MMDVSFGRTTYVNKARKLKNITFITIVITASEYFFLHDPHLGNNLGRMKRKYTIVFIQ